MERYNGIGYWTRGINSPYVWAGTNQYISGLYVSDGRFDPDAVSKNIGAAALFKEIDLRVQIFQ